MLGPAATARSRTAAAARWSAASPRRRTPGRSSRSRWTSWTRSSRSTTSPGPPASRPACSARTWRTSSARAATRCGTSRRASPGRRSAAGSPPAPGGHYATNHTHIDEFVETARMITPERLVGGAAAARLGRRPGPEPARHRVRGHPRDHHRGLDADPGPAAVPRHGQRPVPDLGSRLRGDPAHRPGQAVAGQPAAARPGAGRGQRGAGRHPGRAHRGLRVGRAVRSARCWSRPWASPGTAAGSSSRTSCWSTTGPARPPAGRARRARGATRSSRRRWG